MSSFLKVIFAGREKCVDMHAKFNEWEWERKEENERRNWCIKGTKTTRIKGGKKWIEEDTIRRPVALKSMSLPNAKQKPLQLH